MTKCYRFESDRGLTRRLRAMQSRGRSSVTMQVSSTRGQSRFLLNIWHLGNKISKSEFKFFYVLISHEFLLCGCVIVQWSYQSLYVTGQANCCTGEAWRQPQASRRQQIVHFSQAWPTLSTGMTLEDVDSFIKMVFHFTRLCTTITVEFSISTVGLQQSNITFITREIITGIRTHHGLNSFVKVGWGRCLAWGPCPLGARAWKKPRGHI